MVIAFESPNLEPLGEVGVDFKINWNLVLRHNFEGKLNVHTEMNEDISVINITPCINVKATKAILNSSKAVVLVAYGMGNIPTEN